MEGNSDPPGKDRTNVVVPESYNAPPRQPHEDFDDDVEQSLIRGQHQVAFSNAQYESPQRTSTSRGRWFGSSSGSPPDIQTSPTGDTVGTDISYDMDSPRRQVLTIETKSKGSTAKAARYLKKPVILALGALGLVSSGVAAYFFSRFLEIPGLNEQIERLEAANAELANQVDELELQVDRLANETDRLEEQVDILENTTTRYEFQNELLAGNLTIFKQENAKLSASLDIYASLNTDLNLTVSELVTQVVELTIQNNEYANLTRELNETVTELSGQVDLLQDVNKDLEVLNGDLFRSVDQLSNETSYLAGLANNLNGTVGNLTGELELLAREIDRLETLKADLLSIVSFLNETTEDIDGSFERFTSYLANETASYRALVLTNVERLMDVRTTGWDCDFQGTFGQYEFAADTSLPIGNASYFEVIDYVEQRVLGPLCLDSADFQVYLEETQAQTGELPPVNATMDEITRAISRYKSAAIDYYFPEDGEVGLNPLVWAEADYLCINLPEESIFKATEFDDDSAWWV